MTDNVDVGRVSLTLQRLLVQSKRRLIYDNRTTREVVDVSVESASCPNAFLPAFLGAADAVWREVTDKPLGISIEANKEAVLGYSVIAIKGVPFATVMLFVLEAIEQAAQPGLLVINHLADVWASSETNMRALASSRPVQP